MYKIPELSNEIIHQLEQDNNVMFNKFHREEAYKHKAICFHIWTCHEDPTKTKLLYFYGYKPNKMYYRFDSFAN